MVDRPQEVKIDATQSATWATESTLRKLLNESNTTRGVIEKYLSKIEDWDEAQLAEARNFAKKSQQGVDRTVAAYDQGADAINRGLQGLGVNLTGSFGQIVKGLGVLSSTSGIRNLSTASTIAATALAGASGGLTGFTKYISLAGVEILGLIGSVVAIAHIVEDLNDNFSKLYDSGINVAGGLNGLVDMSKYLELTTGQTAKVLSEYSSTVTILGTQRTSQLIKEFKNLSKSGASFGLNLEQAAESVLTYASIIRTTGDLSSTSVEDLAKNAKKFNEEVSLTSQITGESRKEIEKSIKQQRESVKGIADLSALPKQLRDNMAVLGPQFMSLGEAGKDLQENMIKFLGPLGTAAINRSDLIAMQQVGVWREFEKMGEAIKGGGTDIRSNIDAYADIIANISEEEKGRINYMAEHGNQFAQSLQKMIASSINLTERRKEETKEAQEYLKTHKWLGTVEKAREAMRAENAKKAEAENARAREVQSTLESASTQLTLVFQKLVVNVLEPLLPLLKGLGDGVIWLSERFKDVIDDIKMFSSAFWALMHPFDTLSNGISALSDYFRNFYAEFKDMSVSNMFNAIVDNITETFKKVRDRIMFFFTWSPTPEQERTQERNAEGSPIPVRPRTMKEEFTDLALETGGGLLAAKFLKNKLLGKKAIAPVAEAATPEAAEVAQQAAGVAESITKAKTTLGDSISALTGGVKNAMTSLATGIKDSVSSLAQAVSNVFGSLTKGLGTGLVNIAEGVGGAIKVLGMSLASLGPEAGQIALGSAAVGAAIAAIGAGIAGATWLMGAALPKLSEGINSFAALDSVKLSEVGASFEKLGMGLLKLGGGEMSSAIGGFTSWMSSWVKADPLSQLKQFSALSSEVPALNAIGDALNKFAEGYKNLSESLKESAGSIPGSLDKLKNLSVPEKLSPTSLKFGQVAGGPLPTQSESINLSKAIKDIQQINDQSKKETPVTTESRTGAPGGVPGQADLTLKTMQFYEESKFSNRNTQEVLTQIKMSLDALNNSINNQTSSLSRSIVKASPVIS